MFRKIIAGLIAVFILIVPVSAQINPVNENIKITADKAEVAPVIDGKLDADSYAKINTVPGDFLIYSDSDDYDRWMLKNLPEVYISYDANNFYVFLSGDASKYYYNAFDSTNSVNLWLQSCMQISVATADASYGDRLEIGLARNSYTGEWFSHIWAQSPDGRYEHKMVFGKNCALSLEKGRLNYEVAIPWNTFLPFNPKAGSQFGFNFIYGWSDEGNRLGVEYSSGCFIGKNAELFAKVTLTNNILRREPEEEEPVAPSKYKIGEPIGDVLYSDITAYINGHAIPTSVIKGKTLVVAEDLRNYGFDVIWNGNKRTLKVEINKIKKFEPLALTKDAPYKPGTFKEEYVYTDIRTYLSGNLVESYAINGRTLIDFDSLKKYGKMSWSAKTREIRLTIY